MKQGSSLIISGILTTMVIAAILGISLLSRVMAQGGAMPSTQNSPVLLTVTPEATADTGGTPNGADMEQQYLTQIDDLRNTLKTLDADYGTQLQSLQFQLAEAKATVTALDEKTTAVNDDIAAAQQAIQTADESYQTSLDAMVTDAQQREMSLRAQIETMYAQLQTAYDEIAARQAASAAPAPNISRNNGNNNRHENENDDENEHGEKEHDDD